ncbi:MAG: zinc-binding dehydrogenase [Oscillospiraceae bacterium]
MRALTLTGVKQFELIEKPVPKADERKSVIKVSHAGICGSDLHMIWSYGFGAGTNFVIGHEFSGTIVEPAEGSGFKVGDRVTAMEIDSCLECDECKAGRPQLCKHVLEGGPGIGSDGGYAEYVAVRSDMIRKLPDNVSFLSAAMVEPAAISMHGVCLAGVKEGSTVLVTGGGAIGLFAAACAKALGAKYVAVSEVNEGRIKTAEEADFVDEVFNGADENLLEKLKERVPGGFDATIECSGSGAAATSGLNSLKCGGHQVMIAYGPGPKIDAMSFVNSEWHIDGSLFFTVEEFENVIKFMSEGKLDLEKYAEVISMDEAQKTFEGLSDGTCTAVKYVMDMSR